MWAASQRTQNTRLRSGWPYKDRFRMRVGRRQGHPPGDGEAGLGEGAPPLAWAWSQQGCWLGPSSTGEVGKAPPPQALIGSKSARPPSLPSSPAQAPACSQPTAARAHTAQPSTGNPPPHDRQFLILLPTFPHSWASWPGPSWYAIKVCWVKEFVSEWFFSGGFGLSAGLQHLEHRDSLFSEGPMQD